MSKPTAISKPARVQKICTLWTHDENFSRDDVVFNGDKFPELPATPGSLIRLIALKQTPAVRDFQTLAKASSKDPGQNRQDGAPKNTRPDSHSRRSRSQSIMLTLDENGAVIPGGREVDPEKSYIFVAKAITPDLRSKYPNLQVSIAEKIAKVFGFRNRTQVVVTTADEETHSASHVEISFRDEYLARADMWRMAISELSYRTVYRGQKLLFIGTIKATVKNVYINGQSTHSGYFSSTTKPVFRSESARYVLFIQMSKEMWDFDAEGAGEIMFNKVVNGFLPDLFKRWIRINAKHLVTIILFTRMHYDENSSYELGPAEEDATKYNVDSSGRRFRDYYRVVVSEMASGDWINILYQLKKEFRAFLREVSVIPKTAETYEDSGAKSSSTRQPDLLIAGKPSTATYGNVLEAINLAAAQFAKDYIDRDLVRTGISVIVITAGTGVFEVDYNILKLTTDTLVGSGIGVDLVCLSPMPLHSVPLFKYRNPRLVSCYTPEAGNSPQKRNIPGAEDGPDEKTPRQHQAIFGSNAHISSSQLHTAFPYDQTLSHLEESGEWMYAIPHWLDVSFWSGPSDEIMELTHPRRPFKNFTRSQRKRNTFALRCRMYELQMMGVMENELGNISIPYLEEDVLYPHRLRYFDEVKEKRPALIEHHSSQPGFEPSSPEKHGPDDFPGTDKALFESWMDAYDENVFSSSLERRSSQLASHSKFQLDAFDADTEVHERVGKSVSFPASFESPTQSFGKSARPPPETNFHQLMRERSNESDAQSFSQPTIRSPVAPRPGQPRADVLYRQMSTTKLKEPSHRPSHQRGDSGDSGRRRPSAYATPNDSPAVSRGNTPPKRTPQQLMPPGSSRSSAKSSKASRPAGWFMRQISFGGSGFNATPATGVDAAISSGKVKPARLTVENNQKGLIAAKLASTKNVDVEKPSQPIAIKTSRGGAGSSTSPSSDIPSVETVRQIPSVRTPTASQPGSVAKDSGSLFLFASSRGLREQVGPKPALSSSGGGQQIRRTLSPTSALSPWAVLVNPCNPKKNHNNIPGQFRRWQHVFPKRLKTSSMKWKSLCSPAAVPLTNEYFPTAEQLSTEYNESPYKITQNEDDELVEVPKSRESLVRELIAFRLSHGFQIIVGSQVSEFVGGREHELSNIFHSNYMAQDGDTVFMSVGNDIHQLVCVAGGEVEVKRFSRKPTTALQSSAGIDTPLTYRPSIRTAFDGKYRVRDVILRPPRKEYNWNFIDTFLAGYHDEFSEILRFWRARFVLIPVEIPTVARRPLPLLTEDSEEEIRLEGIRKLTQVWQRYRYIPPEERYFHAHTKKLKDPNPLAIEYQTRDPSAIVAAGPDSALLTEGDTETTSLFSETDRYHTSNIDLKKLAEDLQGERGIQMLDRRWHWRLHYNCFLGFDLTSWLLQNFKDIETRDDAVELGNQLMERGLFQHVQKKHQFRDGNFFYQIAAEYRAPRPESRTGWFGIRRADRSVPSTPQVEGPRSSPLTGRATKSRPSTSDSSSASEDMGEKTPTRAGTPRRAVTLSRVMRYDVDPRKRSYRPEIISLHYDRLHNPDNCYHIRIEWMNVTAKLIEDAIVTWSTSVEKYGLKLIEVPIAEASSISENHPFRAPYIVKLALQPPQHPPESFYDTNHFGPQIKTDPFAYHKALLRRLNFVLDMESASSFPSEMDVRYSWGIPDYRFTQFIHRSGTVLAQITTSGDFLLLANRLINNRAIATRDATRFRPGPEQYSNRGVSGNVNAAGDRSSNVPTTATASSAVSTPSERPNLRSPFSSPLARPVQDSTLLHTQFQIPEPVKQGAQQQAGPANATPTPESVKADMEAFCSDATKLKAFYDEAFKQAPSPSPRIMPVPDNNIPTLGLPPAISIREASWREGSMGNVGVSPSASGGGWSLGAGMSIRDQRRGSAGNVMTLSLGGGKRTGSGGEASTGGSMGTEKEKERVPKRQESGGSVGTG